jgi:hypothetical protein
MAIFAAVCFVGAACFYAKSSQSGLMALYIALAASQANFGAILFMKSKKTR